MRRIRFFVFFLLALTFPVVTQAAIYYLPGAAETAGANNSYFSSTVFITNPGLMPTDVAISFIPNQASPDPGLEILRSVPAGHTIRINRALDTLFALTSDTGTIKLDSPRPIIAWMATANVADPAGTYGLAIEAVHEDDVLVGGSRLYHSIWASHSTDFSRAYRTNVGGVLLDPGSSVEIRVYDSAGVERGVGTVTSPRPASFQVSLISLLNFVDLPVGRVQIDVKQGRAVTYVSVVDNRTSDGIAIAPEFLSLESGDFTLNGVARTPGVNNTSWTTDVRLGNFNPFAIQVNISTLGFATAGNLISRTLQPGHTIEFTDIIGPTGFNIAAGTGALRFSATSPFLVSGRTSNADPTGARPGTFSAYQRPVRYPGGFQMPGSVRTLSGLEQNATVRTNVGFLAGPDGADVNLTLLNDQGDTVKTMTLELEDNEWLQLPIHTLFELFSVDFLARINIRVTSGSVDSYASKIDSGTGDPIVINPATVN